tara:strand:+ start:1521 stop:1868 length:348 start_codon:yes stop_codon:yes gene_type:complete
MSRDHIIQNIGSIIIFIAVVYGITVMMDMVRDTGRISHYIEADLQRVERIESHIAAQKVWQSEHEERIASRLESIEQRNKEDAEFNQLFLKMSGKLDTLEEHIKLLMKQLTKDSE